MGPEDRKSALSAERQHQSAELRSKSWQMRREARRRERRASMLQQIGEYLRSRAMSTHENAEELRRKARESARSRQQLQDELSKQRKGVSNGL